MKAEKLIAQVHPRLRANPTSGLHSPGNGSHDEHEKWVCMIMLSAPEATPPDAHKEYPFNRFGVRVPAILASLLGRRRREKTLFDHSSVRKYLIDKWGLGSTITD